MKNGSSLDSAKLSIKCYILEDQIICLHIQAGGVSKKYNFSWTFCENIFSPFMRWKNGISSDIELVSAKLSIKCYILEDHIIYLHNTDGVNLENTIFHEHFV